MYEAARCTPSTYTMLHVKYIQSKKEALTLCAVLTPTLCHAASLSLLVCGYGHQHHPFLPLPLITAGWTIGTPPQPSPAVSRVPSSPSLP